MQVSINNNFPFSDVISSALYLTASVNLTLIQKDLKYWYFFHPFWVYSLMCPHKETMNLNFAENLVGLRVYPSV